MNSQISQDEAVNLIINTINTIMSNLISSIDNKIYADLDNIVFINKDILSTAFFKNILGSNGLVYLADSFLVGFALYYIVKLYYSNYNEIPIERPYQFFFKMFTFALVIHFSYFICEQVLNLNYLISSSIKEICSDLSNEDVSFTSLIRNINNNASYSNLSFDLFSIQGIVQSITTTGLLGLMLSYSVRYILIQFFILCSPLTFLCLISNSTSWIFKNWSRCFLSLIVLQCFVPFILVICFISNDSSNFLSVASIYALTKINSYIREIFGGLNLEVQSNMNGLINTLKR